MFDGENVHKIKYAKVFPPIGIARVGNSLEADGYFIGPEWPADRHSDDPAFRYKDKLGRIKRQGARFRIYGFDEDGKVIAELTSSNAVVSWTVALANKKASWYDFFSGYNAILHFLRPETDPPDVPPPGARPYESFKFRNSEIGKPSKPGEKWNRVLRNALLNIDGGSRQISGEFRGHSGAELGRWEFVGTFLGKNSVYLGELRTDEQGRLIVLGGRGISAGYDRDGNRNPNNWITHYANNDYWHDDTSDGSITATVKLHNGREIEVKHSARVVCAQPDFAPDTDNLVSLFDAIQQAMADHVSNEYGGLDMPQELRELMPHPDTQYWRDIHPILMRIQNYSWVSAIGLRGHGSGKAGDFFSPATIAQLEDPESSEGARQRQAIFSIIRKPPRPDVTPDDDLKDAERVRHASMLFMPPLAGDEGDRVDGDPTRWLSVTRLQYEHLGRWAEGYFSRGAQPDIEVSDLIHEPAALTRTPLDRACGGGFYPGMEMTSIIRLKELYSEAFRLKDELLPGSIIQYMACPWQADYFECNTYWWPAQRPDEAVNEHDLTQVRRSFPTERARGSLPKLLFPRQSWARGVENERADIDFLRSSCVQPANSYETVTQYLQTQIKWFTAAWKQYVVFDPGGSATPWRVQYLIQEKLDRFGDRHLQFRFPTPEEYIVTTAKGKTDPAAALAALQSFQSSKDLAQFHTDYVAYGLGSCAGRIGDILRPFASAGSVAELAAEFQSLAAKRRDPPVEVSEGSIEFARLAFSEMCRAAADMRYERSLITAGDNGMVKHWSNLGFIVQRDIPSADGAMSTVFAETERNIYEDREYRDYFFILMNLEEYPGFQEYSVKIVERILDQTQALIESPLLSGEPIIEKAFDYHPATFGAKLEEIYEYFREQGLAEQAWLNDNTRAETIQWRLLRSAQFHQLDGSWLRFIADAGPVDEIRALLFDIWSDETGNGNPALNHANLYTALLRGLGIYLPDLESEEYAMSPLLREEDFLNPVFQLCISQHSKRYFAEILGMTLFLEWEVLDSVSYSKRLDYLGFDTQFWRMHIGIDNATDGHGAKARRAVELHLTNALNEGGMGAVNSEWARIWRGFVAFATAGYDYLKAEADFARRRPRMPADRVVDIINSKAHYARLNHGRRRLGKDRLNDFFDEPKKLLVELQQSQWIAIGKPAESRLLTTLTTFQGPMYGVFDAGELDTWREWIVWLGKVGWTGAATSYFSKEQSMEKLLGQIAPTAASQTGHERHQLGSAGKDRKELARWFREAASQKEYKPLMLALRDPENGYIVPYAPDQSIIVLEYLRADRPMGRALDRRYPDINGQIGRKIIVDWIVCGCPVNHMPFGPPPRFRQPKSPKSSLVQVFGKGWVH